MRQKSENSSQNHGKKDVVIGSYQEVVHKGEESEKSENYDKQPGNYRRSYFFPAQEQNERHQGAEQRQIQIESLKNFFIGKTDLKKDAYLVNQHYYKKHYPGPVAGPHRRAVMLFFGFVGHRFYEPDKDYQYERNQNPDNEIKD